ncbi:glycosyltransferase family 1 protein [Gottfriedia solisilvae]|uniref:glycosyltransferase family 1 protein n=1 Tax=Gottfriedia solisilvae TaxID=1516104 RepID=UPI003D2EF837
MENKMPLKVLQVVGAMNRAGTETMLMNIYRNLDREKVQFDFISYNSQEAHYDQEIIRLGGRIIRLSKTQSIIELYKAIKKYGPYDVVHSHTLFHCGIVNIAALLAGVKIRISHAHTTLDKSDSYIRKVYIKLMRLIINTISTNLLACSKGAGHYLFGEKGSTKKTYSYFPNVIEYSKFLQHPKTDVNKFKVEEGIGNSLVIGHIGRFIEAKNHLFLLEILKSLVKRDPTIKLLLVGDGDLRLHIEEESKKAGLKDNVIFVGLRDDIHTMLHCMDIFVFPSLYEGLGLVLLEAQASGVPCIVSEAIQPEADLNVGLITKKFIKDGADAWSDTILEIAKTKEKNTNKIINGFEESGYSPILGISRLLKIYQINNVGENNEKYSNSFV